MQDEIGGRRACGIRQQGRSGDGRDALPPDEYDVTKLSRRAPRVDAVAAALDQQDCLLMGRAHQPSRRRVVSWLGRARRKYPGAI